MIQGGKTRRQIVGKVRAFTESTEYSDMIARPIRRDDPELQLAGGPSLDAVTGLLLAAASYLALSFLRWFFDAREWSWPWLVPLVFFVGIPLIASSRIFWSIFTAKDFEKLYFDHAGAVEKVAVGAVEKQYVSPTEKSDKKEGSFLLAFVTAENATMSYQLDLKVSHKIAVGDVGVLIVQAAAVRGFWRSSEFSV